MADTVRPTPGKPALGAGIRDQIGACATRSADAGLSAPHRRTAHGTRPAWWSQLTGSSSSESGPGAVFFSAVSSFGIQGGGGSS